MTKVPEYARPHNDSLSFGMGMETAIGNTATIVPLITYDEGLGVINSYKSCPQNASFAEYRGAKCYPTSRINNIFAEFKYHLSKEFFETDKLHQLRFATMDIHSAFNETGLAADEVSTLDLNEVLELQVEATDRQMFPLFNTADMKDGATNGLLDLETGQEGLDTDLEIEGVTFQTETFYSALQYRTHGAKLRQVCSGLKWHILTRNRPNVTVYAHQYPNTKFMNPYAFLGHLVYLPLNNGTEQFGKVGDSTDVQHLQCNLTYRYLEHNHEFDHSLQ